MKWIPVSERLPLECQHVIITVASSYCPSRLFVPYGTAIHDCCGWRFTNDEQVLDEVVAWMPLPGPYKWE